MRAEVGDRIVIAAAHVDGAVRDGEIVSTGAGGAAPYRVRWSDSGEETLFFPGPDAHVEHPEHVEQVVPDTAPTTPDPPPTVGSSTTESRGARHTKSWRVDVYVYEGPDSTSAQAVLHGDAPTALQGQGLARRRPGDPEVPEIGDEVAVARALNRLAERLLATAADDLAGVTGHPVRLQP